GAFRGSAERGIEAADPGVAAAGVGGPEVGSPPGARVPAAGPGGSVVEPRGGGRPDAGGRAGVAAASRTPWRISSTIVGAAVGARGVAAVPPLLVVRGHAGMVPVGICAGARPGMAGVAPGLAAGRPGELVARGGAEGGADAPA
ncbi:MAG: hypothetical protein ACXWLA_04365, partial [Myxococcaceae bacterium]